MDFHNNTPTKEEKLLRKVLQMRQVQKRYWNSLQSGQNTSADRRSLLRHRKTIEAEVDAELQEILSMFHQPALF